MELVGIVIVFARRESQVSQGALDLRDQPVLQDHPTLKDPWDRGETKATMANQEAKARQATWDLKGPRAQWVLKESKVT